ncbi:MAG: tetratricopeptide repeat protein [Polyangiaceae bacterium]
MSEPSKATIPTPSASGTLASRPMAHLLVYASERALTGTFVFKADDGGEVGAAYVERGLVSKIRTRGNVAFLGRVLYELGLVTEEALNASLVRLASERRLHGQILLEAGAVTPEGLAEALLDQVARKLHHLLALPPSTTFEFFEGTNVLATFGAPEGTLVDPMPAVWRGIKENPSQTHLATVLGHANLARIRIGRGARLDRFDFEPEELALAESIALTGPLSMKQLLATSKLEPRRVGLLVYLLVITKQGELVKAGEEAEAVVSNTDKRRDPDPVGRMPAISFTPVPNAAMRPDTFPPNARTSTASQPAMRAPAPSHPVVTSSGSYQRTISFNLRAAYDATPRPSSTNVPAARPASTTMPAERAPSSTSVPSARPPMPSASDAVPASQRARVVDVLEDAFVSESEHETLFKRAEACLARGNLDRALSLCQAAHEIQPDKPEYLALLGHLEFQRPASESPHAAKTAMALLDRALRLDKHCEKAWFYRGHVQKKLGNADAAAESFRRAARLNPYNIDAMREVRLHEMRVRNGSIPPSSRPPRSMTPAPGSVRSSTPPPGSVRSPASTPTPPSKPPGGIFSRFKRG